MKKVDLPLLPSSDQKRKQGFFTCILVILIASHCQRCSFEKNTRALLGWRGGIHTQHCKSQRGRLSTPQQRLNGELWAFICPNHNMGGFYSSPLFRWECSLLLADSVQHHYCWELQHICFSAAVPLKIIRYLKWVMLLTASTSQVHSGCQVSACVLCISYIRLGWIVVHMNWTRLNTWG